MLKFGTHCIVYFIEIYDKFTTKPRKKEFHFFLIQDTAAYSESSTNQP